MIASDRFPSSYCEPAPPSEAEWQSFFEAFRVCTGVDLNLYKAPQLRRRLLELMIRGGDRCLRSFWDRVSRNLGGLAAVMDALAINVSELFRDSSKWSDLSDRILPDLLKHSTRLKCWSAGCSFGAEVHSLAISLDIRYPGPHSILGTDIDATALRQAAKGEFADEHMNSVPLDIRRSYFDYLERPGIWRANGRVQPYMTFRRGNLLADAFDTGFDLILCRNVVIYFTEQAKEDLYRKFYRALKPGGVLFVGSTERILNAEEIGFEPTFPFYRKPIGR